MEIIFLNDEVGYNKRYRTPLIELIESKGHSIRQLGLKEEQKISFKTLIILSISNSLLISSNLKSNIVSLAFFWKKGLIILNGLGRYRDNKKFRFVLLLLIRLNNTKTYAVQSYADYRYIKKYNKTVNIHWIPGSGGNKKAVSNAESYILIQRNNKVRLTAADTCKFLNETKIKHNLNIVGCTDSNIIKDCFENINYNLVGYVDKDDLFKTGNTFIQPSGYGEGFPHTLADAIASNMIIYINNKEYLKYGLSKIGGKKIRLTQEWSELLYDQVLKKAIGSVEVTEKYYKIIEKKL